MSSQQHNIARYYPYKKETKEKGITFTIKPVAKYGFDNTYTLKQESKPWGWAPLYDRAQEKEKMDALVSELLNQYIW